MVIDMERARDALHAIDPACSREQWVRIGMAAKSAGLDLADFDAWSSSAASYRQADCAAVWRSIEADRGIGVGTLFAEAARAGWRPESTWRRNGQASGATRPAERTQAEIDRVLDKISASGITSLTPAERKFLAEMSRRMRDRT